MEPMIPKGRSRFGFGTSSALSTKKRLARRGQLRRNRIVQSGHGIKAHIREEDEGGSLEHAVCAIREEINKIACVGQNSTSNDHKQDGHNRNDCLQDGMERRRRGFL